jgi:hypothetical protein
MSIGHCSGAAARGVTCRLDGPAHSPVLPTRLRVSYASRLSLFKTRVIASRARHCRLTPAPSPGPSARLSTVPREVFPSSRTRVLRPHDCSISLSVQDPISKADVNSALATVSTATPSTRLSRSHSHEAPGVAPAGHNCAPLGLYQTSGPSCQRRPRCHRGDEQRSGPGAQASAPSAISDAHLLATHRDVSKMLDIVRV